MHSYCTELWRCTITTNKTQDSSKGGKKTKPKQKGTTNPFNRLVNGDTKLVKWKHLCVREAEASFTGGCKEE